MYYPKRTYHLILLSIIVLVATSCIEEIEVQTQDFDDFLTVEAILTNEFKNHEIKLSRTFSFEENSPRKETGANVEIKEGDTSYSFSETSPGTYTSRVAFSAKSNINYQLLISTSDGSDYVSNTTQLTEITPMDNLYFERGFDESEQEGVSVFVDTFDPNNASKFYRFEYEETYKIIAPLYVTRELVVVNRDFPIPDDIPISEITDYFVDLRLRTEQKQICFNTVKSNKINLTSTTDLSEDRLDKFRVHFINRSNYIITHRYSILVRQFIQSREAHTYYKTLNEFSESESVLSENQPGFIQGNISNTNESSASKVIGFFEVSSVDSKRIYFNYSDLFPGETIPPYAITCNPLNAFAPSLWNTDPGHPNLAVSSPLVSSLDLGFQFYEENPNDNEAPFPYQPFLLVPKECGDCTALGQTKIPDFWEE